MARSDGKEPKTRSRASRDSSGARREAGSRAGLLGWLLAAVALIAITAFAVNHKIEPSRDEVFAGNDVRLLGADAYYHLRHARIAAESGIQRWDVGTHYPAGQRSRNAALFDWLGGTVANLLADDGPPTRDQVATAIAWIPPVCAGLACVLLFAIGAAIGGRLAGLLAAASFALYPGNAAIKMLLGFADHHALEVVLACGSLALLVAALRTGRRMRLWSVAAGLSLFVFFVSWAGAPLFIGFVAAALVVAWVFEILHERDPREVSAVGLLCFASLAGAAAVTGLLVSDWVLMPGLLWPTIAGAGALAAAFWQSARITPWLLAEPRRRFVALAAVLAPVVLGVLAVLFVPPVERAFGAAFFKMSTVSEHRSVGLWSVYGPLIPLAAVGVIGAFIRGRRVEIAAATAAITMVITHAISHDYGYLAAPMVAVAATVGVVAIVRAFHRRSPARGQAAAFGCALLVGAPVGLGWTADPWPSEAVVDVTMLYDDAWDDANRWLREHTPEPTLDLRATGHGPWDEDRGFHYPAGTYGVVVPWSFGNFVAAMAERPVMWSQGIGGHVAGLLVATDEEKILADLRAGMEEGEELRYLVLDADTAGPQAVSLFEQAGLRIRASKLRRRIVTREYKLNLLSYGDRFDDSLVSRLYLEDGRASGHFRLVYETPHQRLVGYKFDSRRNRVGRLAEPVTDRNRDQLERLATSKLPSPSPFGFVYDAQVTSAIKVFRIEEGAVLEGRAEPGTEVVASVELYAPTTDRLWTYSRSAVAGDDGRYRVRVAYPTDRDPSETGSTIEVRGPYRIRSGEQDHEVRVSVKAVREGRSIDVSGVGSR